MFSPLEDDNQVIISTSWMIVLSIIPSDLVRTGTILLGTLIVVMKVAFRFRPRTLIQTLQLRLLSLEEKLQNSIDSGIMAQSDEIFTAQIERNMGRWVSMSRFLNKYYILCSPRRVLCRIRYRIFELQEKTLLTSGGIPQEIKAVCKGHSLNIMECHWDVDALERDIEVPSSKLFLFSINISHTDQSCNSLGSRVGSEPWYRYSASIEARADHSMPNSMVASTN